VAARHPASAPVRQKLERATHSGSAICKLLRCHACAKLRRLRMLACAFCAAIASRMNTNKSQQLSPLELRKKISVAEAAELNAMHPATFRRHHAHLIRRVGKRRQAVELGDAIALPVRGTNAASR